jgi:hypothetical protein
MLFRWLSILAFVALKVCETAFVACLVLARMTKTKQSSAGSGLPPQSSSAVSLQSPEGLGLPSQSSVTSLKSTATSPVLGAGAGTGAGPLCSSGQSLRKLGGAAATNLAALLEVRTPYWSHRRWSEWRPFQFAASSTMCELLPKWHLYALHLWYCC